jgi:hypothetical protein
MLRIQRSANGGVVFSLSGRIEAADIVELQRLLGLEAGGGITFDLREITMVDGDAVRFLERLEAEGIKFKDCPPYIRGWIDTERGGSSRKKD